MIANGKSWTKELKNWRAKEKEELGFAIADGFQVANCIGFAGDGPRDKRFIQDEKCKSESLALIPRDLDLTNLVLIPQCRMMLVATTLIQSVIESTQLESAWI